MDFLSFATRDIKFAIELNAVVEVALLPEIQSIPSSLEALEGVINFRGRVIPVFCLAALMGQKSPRAHLYQYLLIIKSSTRILALRVEKVLDNLQLRESEIVNPITISPHLKKFFGLAEGPFGIVLIQSPEDFLSSAELVMLDQAFLSFGGKIFAMQDTHEQRLI